MSSVILPANDERKKATPRGNHVKRCEIMPLLSAARNMHKAGAKGGANFSGENGAPFIIRSKLPGIRRDREVCYHRPGSRSSMISGEGRQPF